MMIYVIYGRLDELGLKLEWMMPIGGYACLMHHIAWQTWKLHRSLKVEEEDLFDGEDVLHVDPMEDINSTDFDIVTDPNYPGQFRVVSPPTPSLPRLRPTSWMLYFES